MFPHTCILSYLHTCILAYLQTCILAFLHTCTLAYLQTAQQYLFYCSKTFWQFDFDFYIWRSLNELSLTKEPNSMKREILDALQRMYSLVLKDSCIHKHMNKSNLSSLSPPHPVLSIGITSVAEDP